MEVEKLEDSSVNINKINVFLMKRDLLQIENKNDGVLSVLKLRHPRTKLSTLYITSSGGELIHEVLSCDKEKRSWVIDNTMYPSGKLHISSPMDPLFLVLPYLKEASRCCPLDQLLQDDDFKDTESLLKLSGLKHINNIADSKGNKSLNAYIYNENKTLNWLKRKIERVARLLKEKGIHVDPTLAMSANFVQSEKIKYSPESYTLYAHGMVSEYLPDDLSLRLADFLNLPKEEKKSTLHKRKEIIEVMVDEERKEKKIKIEESIPNSHKDKIKEKVTKPKESTKEKARAKAAVGSKSISLFFKKA